MYLLLPGNDGGSVCVRIVFLVYIGQTTRCWRVRCEICICESYSAEMLYLDLPVLTAASLFSRMSATLSLSSWRIC